MKNDNLPTPSAAWIDGWNARILALYDEPEPHIPDDEHSDWYRGYRSASKEIAKRGFQS